MQRNETAETLKVTTPSDCEIAMTRVFDAPRKLVFQALTKPELVKRWLLGPPGWSMPICEIDLRVGGTYRYVWRNDAGREFGMGGVYQEIAAPARIVHTERFEEEEAFVTTTLTEDAGGTTLTTIMQLASREARDEVLETGMDQGVAASYELLDEILADQREACRAGEN